MEAKKQYNFYRILDWAVLAAIVVAWAAVLCMLISVSVGYKTDSGLLIAFIIFSVILVLKILSMIFFSRKIVAEMYGSEGLEYTLSDDGKSYYVSGEGSLESINVIVPSYYERLPVVGIGENAFSSDSEIASVALSENIGYIAKNAFGGCGKLMKVSLPKSLKEIGEDAFKDCFRLYEIYNKSSLPVKKGEETFGGVALYAKIVHTKIDGDCVKGYGDDVIYEDEKERILLATTSQQNRLEIGEGLGKGTEFYLAPHCFENENFYYADIPAFITEIPAYAFSGCKKLNAIELPDEIVGIDDGAFEGCANLEKIVLPPSLKHIGKNAFSGCDKLAFVVYNGESKEEIVFEGGNEELYNILFPEKQE